MSLFINITGNTNIIQNLFQPTEEGWGMAFMAFGGMGVGGVVGAQFGNALMGPLGGVVGGSVGMGIGAGIGLLPHAHFSEKFIKKAVQNPKLIAYLKTQCDKIYAEEKKKNADITYQVPMNLVKYKAKKSELMRHELLNKKNKSAFSAFHYNKSITKKIIKYEVVVAYDTNHIQAVIVLFYNPKKDLIFKRSIPAPSDKDTKYYKE